MSKWLRRAALALVSTGLLFNFGCEWGLNGLLNWQSILQSVAIGNIFD